MSHTTSEVKNDSITATISREPDCLVRMEVRVSPESVKSCYKKAIKNVNKEISLPGFRKGRAPDELILKHHKSQVESEWKQIVVETAYQEATKLSDTYPYGESGFRKPKIPSCTLEEGATVEIAFETPPKVPELDLKSFAIEPVTKEEVTDEKVEEAVKDLLLDHAEWKDVEGRPVQENDYVDLDIVKTGETEEQICKDTRFETKKGVMGDWMLKLVLGKNPGESVEGTSEMDPNNPVENFKPTPCRITVKRIVEAHPPELNEEFAKKLGADNVEDLKAKIRKDLENQAEDKLKAELRRQVRKNLLEKYPFDIPASFTKEEAKQIAEGQTIHLAKKDPADADVIQQRQEAAKRAKQEVEDKYRLFFMANKIGKDQNISVSQQELMQEYVSFLYQNQGKAPNIDPEAMRSELYYSILVRKSQDWIAEQAQKA